MSNARQGEKSLKEMTLNIRYGNGAAVVVRAGKALYMAKGGSPLGLIILEEMSNIMKPLEKLLNDLSELANDETFVFKRLYRNLYDPALYQKSGLSPKAAEAVVKSLRDQSYKPQPASKNNRSDQAVQEAVCLLLSAVYGPLLSGPAYGFGESQNCHSCLLEIEDSFLGSTWFIETVIEGAFDHIDHALLIELLKRRIKDDRFINLIRKFLKAGYLEDWVYGRTYSGCPRGSSLSELLVNIYLGELDGFITKTLKPQFGSGLNNQEQEKEAGEKTTLKEKSKTAGTIEAGGNKSLRYVRYADKLFFGLTGSKADCRQLIEKLASFLKGHLKLDLSEKIRVTRSDKPAYFLGYEIKVIEDQSLLNPESGRTGGKRVQLKIPKSLLFKTVKEKKLVKDLSAKQWRPIYRPDLLNKSEQKILTIYNSALKGLYDYFCLAENVSSVMGSLAYIMEYSCLATLARKHQVSVKKFLRSHSHGPKRWGITFRTDEGPKTLTFYRGFRRRKKESQGDPDKKPKNSF